MTELVERLVIFPENCNHHRVVIFGGYFLSELDLAAAADFEAFAIRRRKGSKKKVRKVA